MCIRMDKKKTKKLLILEKMYSCKSLQDLIYKILGYMNSPTYSNTVFPLSSTDFFNENNFWSHLTNLVFTCFIELG